MEDVEAEIRRKAAAVAVFVRMGLRAGLQGVPGGAQGAKGSLWCPAGREKTGKKRENLSRAGHRRRKRALVPRRQRKSREEERKSGSGGAWGAKGSLWCPAAKEKTGKKRGNPSWAGHGRRKRAVMPRRQRKSREEERKSEAGGAWGAKGSLWCPAAKEKAGKKRENPRRAGHREQKEALIPRLPSINRPAWDKRASLIKLLGEQYLFSDFYTTTDAVRAGAQYFAGFDSLQLLTYGTAGFLTELVQQFFGKLVGRSLGGGILDVSVTVLHASQHDST